MCKLHTRGVDLDIERHGDVTAQLGHLTHFRQQYGLNTDSTPNLRVQPSTTSGGLRLVYKHGNRSWHLLTTFSSVPSTPFVERHSYGLFLLMFLNNEPAAYGEPAHTDQNRNI